MASLHVPIIEVRIWSKEQGIVSRRTKLYIHDGLGRGRVYAENEMVYGKVNKQKLQSIRLLVMARECALVPWQCLPGPIFRPRNFNIKIGPGDEARIEGAYIRAHIVGYAHI